MVLSTGKSGLPDRVLLALSAASLEAKQTKAYGLLLLLSTATNLLLICPNSPKTS